MDYYQKWLLERVNELYDRTYNVDPDQICQFLSDHGKASLAALAVTVYILKKERTHKSFKSLQDAPPSYPGLHPAMPTNFSGNLLRSVAYLANTKIGDWFINPFVLKVLGIDKFRSVHLEEISATFYPVIVDDRINLSYSELQNRPDLPDLSHVLNAPTNEDGFVVRDVKFYTDGYKAGKFTPLDIAERILAILDEKNDELNAFCDYRREYVLKAAQESTDRWKAGKQLSIVDGVPIAVKDQLAVIGHTRKNGLDMEEKDSIKDYDTVMIQRVRAAGLVIIGISHMTQMGMAVFGNNPSKTHKTCKNPMNPAYYPGASSSGTAASICSGLVPFGIGTDGGGSIRMPSSQCGIVGLKPTFGRCPSHGRVKGAVQGTVSHAGPMAATSNDLAILYTILAGPHHDDPYSVLQPKVTIPAAFTPGSPLTGLKIGVDWLWAKQANSDVYEGFRRSIDYLKEMGAEICQVNVSLIPETNTGHLIAISAEGGEAAKKMIHNGETLSAENYLILNAALSSLTAADYINSARLRTLVMKNMSELFAEVDILATPTCGQTAEPILTSDEAAGTWKLKATMMSMLYVKLGNFTGIPAISCPSGYNSNGLPTGLMLHAKWYDEEKLIQCAYQMDHRIKRNRPKVYYDI